jgi:hypothetical protein
MQIHDNEWNPKIIEESQLTLEEVLELALLLLKYHNYY